MPNKFKFKNIQFRCGDCGVFMERAKEPLTDEKENHMISICPQCKMEIQSYKNSVIDTNGPRPVLEISWGLTLDQKKTVIKNLKAEKERKRKWQEEADFFNQKLNEIELEEQNDSNKGNS